MVNGAFARYVVVRPDQLYRIPDHFTLEWFLTKADGKEERAVVLNHTRQKP